MTENFRSLAHKPPFMRPTVSVLIAAYNASPFLGRAVNSALAQGNAVTEIIVVDDCSTDATLELAEAMSRKDGRIKVVHLPKNAGPSVARNAGLEVASGDWVAILDADDAYAPGRVERLVTVAAAQDADIVADKFSYYDPATDASSPATIGFTDEMTLIDIKTFLTHARPFGTDTDWGLLKPMFKQEFLADRSLRYPSDSRHGEDFLFVMDALLEGAKYVASNFHGYMYTPRGAGWSRTTVNYDGQVDQSKKLLLDHRLSANSRLVGLLKERIRAMERLSAEHKTQTLIAERRLLPLATAGVTDWRIAASILRQVKNKVTAVRAA
ncbi:glycosyltransferase family 2 protein [Mesorhizobium sp. WSM4976]|uniref:glycosyltransferase family 2 protein n=1 Tax=Mesorhizobium sp. WSM4976 TaxID=3038549 RepID=UPI002416FCDA|nr:glycosyltransferase family 2 protein [Mesorhizobium sp. WSM4976]MDG4895961.1 glycosyltransferase family 2 protein [Mesorhizobium sp. WSM4976]